MRPIVVLVMLVVYAVVICESAAVAKQRRGVKPAPASAAESPTRWFPGLAFPGFAKNKRFILPSIKHHTSEQKHKRTNELEDRDYLGAIGISSSNWGGSSSSSSHWNDDDWP